MPLTSCRNCGSAVHARSHACPQCGASLAPALPAYALPPRPPAPPERPWWKTAGGWVTAAGWMVILAGVAVVGLFIVRASAESGRRATENAEVETERAYQRKLTAWIRDTSATTPVPEGRGRPVPTSTRGKRMWVVSEMLMARTLWEREVLKRHNVDDFRSPAAWGTTRYQASARDYPEVAAYLEGRVAVIAELRKTSAARMEERVAALARESGMPTRQIRDLFPANFLGVTEEEARQADVMLEVHRHYVRMDPRVRYAGGEELLYQRPDDVRRTHEIVARLHRANTLANEARQRKFAEERAFLSRAIE